MYIPVFTCNGSSAPAWVACELNGMARGQQDLICYTREDALRRGCAERDRFLKEDVRLAGVAIEVGALLTDVHGKPAPAAPTPEDPGGLTVGARVRYVTGCDDRAYRVEGFCWDDMESRWLVAIAAPAGVAELSDVEVVE